MSNERRSPGCRVCGSVDVDRWLNPLEMMLGRRTSFAYFCCAGCGCLQLESVPADLGNYYPENYYSFDPEHDLAVTPHGYVRQKFVLPQMTRHLLGWGSITGRVLCQLSQRPIVPYWLRFLPKPIPFDGGVLDVGCGSGANLVMLRDCGFTNLLGVDPFMSKPLSHDGGINLVKCDLQAVHGKFSLIMFHHVFEHLDDLVSTLTKARQLLGEGGQIIIRIPLSDSVAARKYQEHWVQLDAPRHINLQTRKSMNLLAEKSALRISNVVYDSFEIQFWGSEQYMQDISLFDPRSYRSGLAPSVFSAEQIKFFVDESVRLNAQEQGDQAAFVLEVP